MKDRADSIRTSAAIRVKPSSSKTVKNPSAGLDMRNAIQAPAKAQRTRSTLEAEVAHFFPRQIKTASVPNARAAAADQTAIFVQGKRHQGAREAIAVCAAASGAVSRSASAASRRRVGT